MIYLVLFVVALVLFFGFLGLTAYEGKRGSRLFAPARAALDAKAERVEDVLKHVDFSTFTWHLVKDVTSRIVHDVAHISLIVIRSIERFLTRLVRYLRAKAHAPAPVEGKQSAFVETITYFKKTLRRSKKTPAENTVE